jgi:phosphate transport system substrate-binding protein
MKYFKITMVLIAITLLFNIKPAVCQQKINGKITISGAFALYPMMVKWAEEFKKVQPGIKIDVSAGGAGKGITDALGGMVDIGMVSRDIYPEEVKKGAFAIPVARDAVVCVMSESNPALKEVLAKGITAQVAAKIWISGDYRSWAEAFRIKQQIPLHVYTRSDACGAAEVWAKYIGGKQEDLTGSGVFGDPGLALAVKRDKVGIGFNNIGYAYDQKTRRQISGIRVIPIDINKNGKVDPEEQFYETMDDLTEAIAEGKYPAPPARDLYLVTKGKPTNPAATSFIKWILTDGQKYVKSTGYINLAKTKVEAAIKKL